MLLYGHLDKQPEMVGWREGLGPWTPVIEDGKLYGRGGADDGYAVFASLAAIRALQRAEDAARAHRDPDRRLRGERQLRPARLPRSARAAHRQSPDLVVGLDSGCGNYEQLWGTTSLRGLVNGVLTVEVLTEGVHSGDASGVVPSSFRIARMLLDRIEDADTGIVQARRLPRADSRRARRAGAARGRGARRGDLAQVPVRAGHGADAGRTSPSWC